MKLLAYVLFATLCVLLMSCGSYKRIEGKTGQQGPPGDTIVGPPGQGVTVVQFCPSAGPPAYGNWPEFGQCIDNKLYAVFWDGHQAWWSQIPPGAYLSTATGLACNFTVVSGCSLQAVE